MSEDHRTALWDSWATTAERHVRRVNTGGRSFHAIDPYYRFRRATEAWGPCGTGWGWDHTYEIIDTHTPAEADGPNQILLVAHVALWYGPPDARGYVHATGAAWLVQRTRRGAMTDDESHKKALTDGLTKCLSYLGLGADVFMGRHDDSKYIAELRAAEVENQPAQHAEDAEVAKMLAAFDGIDVPHVEVFDYVGKKVGEPLTLDDLAELREFYSSAKQMREQNEKAMANE